MLLLFRGGQVADVDARPALFMKCKVEVLGWRVKSCGWDLATVLYLSCPLGGKPRS